MELTTVKERFFKFTLLLSNYMVNPFLRLVSIYDGIYLNKSVQGSIEG